MSCAPVRSIDPPLASLCCHVADDEEEQEGRRKEEGGRRKEDLVTSQLSGVKIKRWKKNASSRL